MRQILDTDNQIEMPAKEIVKWAKRFVKLKLCTCNHCFEEGSKLLNFDTLIRFKEDLNELLPGEYELYILTLLQQAIQKDRTVGDQKPRNSSQRRRKTVVYQLHPYGHICRPVFKELLGN